MQMVIVTVICIRNEEISGESIDDNTDESNEAEKEMSVVYAASGGEVSSCALLARGYH